MTSVDFIQTLATRQSKSVSQDDYFSSDLDSHADDLADALRRAIRHGRLDQDRRLHRELIGLGRDVPIFELAASSSVAEGGGR